MHAGSWVIKQFHHPEDVGNFAGDRNGSSETCLLPGESLLYHRLC